jgi:hypothetical protein
MADYVSQYAGTEIDQAVAISSQNRSDIATIKNQLTQLNQSLSNMQTSLQGQIDAKVAEVVAGDNISVDDSDPTRPVVSGQAGGGGGTDDPFYQGQFDYFGTRAQINALTGVAAGATAISSDYNQRGDRGSSSWTWTTLDPVPASGMWADVNTLLGTYNNKRGEIRWYDDGVHTPGWVVKTDEGILSVLVDQESIKGNGADTALVSYNNVISFAGLLSKTIGGVVYNDFVGTIELESGAVEVGAIVHDSSGSVGVLMDGGSVATWAIKTITMYNPNSGGGGGSGTGIEEFLTYAQLQEVVASMVNTGTDDGVLRAGYAES